MYASGVAMWSAVVARAKAASKETGRPVDQLVRQFLYERLLARVFDGPDEPWVLKGGTALLVRVHDARHSKDVDLYARLDDVDDAVEQLRRALDRDLGDFFRFEIAKVLIGGGTEEQPDVNGRKLTIVPYVGSRKLPGFKIDLVTGSLMTADPDLHQAPALVEVPGIPRPTYRLYPAVDHLADKLCATEALYSGEPSSRVRDLIDIVVIARTQPVSLSALRTAIAGERTNRGLPERTTFDVPPRWEDLFPKTASATGWAASMDFADAVDLARRLLDPALAPADGESVWDPAAGMWAPAGN